jgi:hypothetical protein
MAEPKLLNFKNPVITFLGIIFIMVLSSCATGQPKLKDEDIAIDNYIKECIDIIPQSIIEKQNSLYLNAKLETKKSAGYCGCKSAMLTYKVVAKREDGSSILSYQNFSPLNQDEFDFLIGNDFEPDYNSLTMFVQCKNPD